MNFTKIPRRLGILGASFMLLGKSHATLVYEAFDYPADLSIAGQGAAADGWAGSWVNSGGSNQPVSVAGQSFPDLQVTGLAAQRPVRNGNGAITRPISATSQTALTANGSTAWFSVLMTATGGDGFAVNSYGTFIFGDAPLSGGSGTSAAPIQGAGNAFGVSFAGTGGGGDFSAMRIQAVAYDGGALTQQSPTTVGSGTSLIVGRIDWAANGSNDTLNLYLVTNLEADLGAPFATITSDLDQANFNQISIGDSQTSVFDEIRFGAALDDVLPVSTDTPPPPPPVSDGPNIIYILVDDMGYSDLGCYGGEIDTPHIDSIAAEGITFRQFYNNAKCEPTRTSIMTGLYHGRGGNTSGGATLAEALKTVNYQTYAVGKWHLGSGSSIPTRQGFDNFYGIYGGFSDYFPAGLGTSTIKRDAAVAGNLVSAYPDSSFNSSTGTTSSQNSFSEDYYMTDGLGDNAVAFIEDATTNHDDKPFFMYLAFNAPHTPLQAPLDLINKYRGTYMEGWDVLRQRKWEKQKELGLVDPGWQLSNVRDDISPWDSLSDAQKEAEDHRRAVYAAMMDSIDQNVGKVLQALDAAGIADDTLIIFTGDNGAQAFDNTSNRASSPSDEDSRWSMGPAWASYSNTPFRYYKQAQHQGGICTSFVARWPEVIAPGTMTDQPGHIVDMMATFVDISEADYDSLTKDNGSAVPPMDGKSLMPIFEGGTRPAPDFWGFEFSNSEFGVIQGDWKLVAFSSSPWRLFNLKEDRTETNNLRWDYPDKVAELAVLYDQWAIDTYGDTSATYAERDLRSQLTQELRYTQVLGGGLVSAPGGLVVDLNGINAGGNFSMNDHWEFYDTDTRGSGLAPAADSFIFASKSFFGNGQVIAQVESMDNLTANGFGGIMLRESIAADSSMVALGINPAGELLLSVRSANGEAATITTAATGLTLPVFFQLDRSDQQITPSYSTNGTTWTQLAPITLNFPVNLRAGLASASGSTGSQGDVIFREWEQLDIAAYPLRPRELDGLSQFLVYALGLGSNESAANALPKLSITSDAGQEYPEMTFRRRIGFPESQFSINWLGENLDLYQNDSANWSPLEVTPNPNGISESVRFRRNELPSPKRGFFSLGVDN
ncbi:arylsulfatase [bacterium]|nr:arylsulfatase [bacterium]